MVGRGRQKTKLTLIEKQESRLVCFSKRRSGLFKKATELSILTGANVGAVVFSPAGKLFALEPQILDSLLGCPTEKDSDSSTESESVDAIVRRNETSFWWKRPQVQSMNCEELLQFRRQLLDYGEKKFGARAEQMFQGTQQGPDERTLSEENPSFCGNDSTDERTLSEENPSFCGKDSTDERTLLEENPSFCGKDSTEPVSNSVEMETEMFPSTFDQNLVFDEQWLEWFHGWMMEA